MPYAAWQSGPDAGFPTGRLHYWKAGWLRDLTGAAITTLSGPPGNQAVLVQRDRAAAHGRRRGQDRPDRHRVRAPAEQYDMLILSQWADPADTARNVAWTRETFAAMEPHLADAVYVNNLGEDEGRSRVQAAYEANYDRLAEVKRRYDPGNLFRLNQDIVPAPA